MTKTFGEILDGITDNGDIIFGGDICIKSDLCGVTGEDRAVVFESVETECPDSWAPDYGKKATYYEGSVNGAVVKIKA